MKNASGLLHIQLYIHTHTHKRPYTLKQTHTHIIIG